MNDRHDMSAAQDRKRHAFLMEHGLGSFYKLAPDHVGYITGATMEKLVDLALAAQPPQDAPWGWVVGGHLYHSKKLADQAAWITDAAGKPRPMTPVYLAASAPAQQATPTQPVAAEEFIRDLLWNDHPECCGCPEFGAEYMGQRETVCCGNPEPAMLNDKQIVATLRAKFPESGTDSKALAPLPPAALAEARAFGAGLDAASLEQPSEVV